MLTSVGTILKHMGFMTSEFIELLVWYPDTYWDGKRDSKKVQDLSILNPAMFHYFEALATPEHSGLSVSNLLKTGQNAYSLQFTFEVYKVYKSILEDGQKVVNTLRSNQNVSLALHKQALSNDMSY
jgi:hypothetical protein